MNEQWVVGIGIAVGVCFAIFGLAIMAVFGALLLWLAIVIYNGLAGNDVSRHVPMPSFFKAMGLALLAGVTSSVASFAILMLVGLTPDMKPDLQNFDFKPMILQTLMGFPIGLVAMTPILTSMLPTTLLRGFLVALIHSLIYLAIGGVMGGGFYMLVQLAKNAPQ